MGSNVGPQMEVAKPAIFSGEAGRIGGFITACRLYIKMRLRGNTVEEQVQWVLTYVQGRSAEVWKENIMEELESGEVEYEPVEELFTCLKKEFGGGEKESVKAAELRKLEQGGRTMEEFIQEFKRVARGSGYEGRLLVEEFKRGINGGIRRWIGDETVMLAGDLGTWPITVEIEEEGDRWIEEGWNMEEEGSRRFSIKGTI